MDTSAIDPGNHDAGNRGKAVQVTLSALEQAELDYEAGVAAIRSDDLDKAIDLLGKCLETMVGHYGEEAGECARVYLKYGSALFYKAQADSDVFGDSISAKAVRDKEEAARRAAEEEEDEDEDEGDDKGDDKGEEEIGGEDGGEEPEGSDMELAWDMLEVARKIYSKQPARTLEEGDTLSKLAEVSMEREDWARSIEDCEASLAIYRQLLPPIDRRIADVLFRMTLALENDKDVRAVQTCSETVAVFEMRLTHMRNVLAGNTEGNSATTRPDGSSAMGEVTREQAEREVTDLTEILADLREKEAELREQPPTKSGSSMQALKEACPELAAQLEGGIASLKQIFTAMAGGPAVPPATEEAGADASKENVQAEAAVAASAPAPVASVSIGFGAPAATVAGGKPVVVTDLGVVGRGRNRVTLQPVALPNGNTKEEPTAPVPKRRTLDDMMGGGDKTAIETSIGFGAPAEADAKKPKC
eukprot:jgi/Mesvir1/9274/Mv03135-RA.1